MPRSIVFVLLTALLISCDHLTRKFAENVIQEKKQLDSIQEHKRDNPIAIEKYEVLERKKSGDDSLFLVRTFLVNGKKFNDSWYKWHKRHGLAKFYYANGQLCSSIIYRNDTIVTITEAYTPEGEKRPGGFVKNGTGEIKFFHPTTFNLLLHYRVKNYMKEGKLLRWHENGNKEEECSFVHDTLEGDYTRWFKSGVVNILRKESPEKNKVTITYYYPSGKIKKHEVYKDSYPFSVLEYDEQGNTTTDQKLNEKGELVGVRFYYSSTRKLLSRGTYVNNMKDGPYEYFHENGQKKAIEVYSKDTMVSEKRWKENGKPSMEAYYQKGELHGTLKQYFENGQLMLAQEYVNGVKQGKYVSYYSNGKLCNEGYYENDKPKGEMKYYRNDGTFERTKNFP